MVNLTPLCEIAFKYKTDKCPQIEHNYTPLYYEMFADKRESVKKVVEIGIGTPKTMWFVEGYESGASLKMWRDFFPNAQIYGADISPESSVESERIKTFIFDETKTDDIQALLKETGTDIDIFIDDASHTWQDQVFLARTVLPWLGHEVTYIIEDVGWPQHIINALKDYECIVPPLDRLGHRAPKNRVIIIKNK